LLAEAGADGPASKLAFGKTAASRRTPRLRPLPYAPTSELRVEYSA